MEEVICETSVSNGVSNGVSIGASNGGVKKKIVYSKEFLLKLRDSPLSKMKPDLPRVYYCTIPGPDDLIKKPERKEKVSDKKGHSKFSSRKNTRSYKHGKGSKKPRVPYYKPDHLVKTRDYTTIIKSSLNKLTVERYTSISNQIKEVLKWCDDTQMNIIVCDLLKKAQYELHFCQLYSRLAKELTDSEEFGKTFDKHLIDLVKSEFSIVIQRKPEEDEEKAFGYRKRDQGIGCFIAELANVRLLAESDLFYWIKEFYTYKRVEALCKLTLHINKRAQSQSTLILNTMISNLKELRNDSGISSRQKFMIDDMMELKDNNWRALRKSHKQEKPKTLLEVRKSANKKEFKTLPIMNETRVKSSSIACIEEYLSLPQKDGREEVLYQFKTYSKFSNIIAIKTNFIRNVINFAIEKGETEQDKIADLLKFLINEKCISRNGYLSVLKEFDELVPDLKLDIPKIEEILVKFHLQ